MHPFVVLVSVLFGSTLFGVLGALLAIPVAAAIQITIREFTLRHDHAGGGAPRRRACNRRRSSPAPA